MEYISVQDIEKIRVECYFLHEFEQLQKNRISPPQQPVKEQYTDHTKRKIDIDK
jgi:hypothetical protein